MQVPRSSDTRVTHAAWPRDSGGPHCADIPGVCCESCYAFPIECLGGPGLMPFRVLFCSNRHSLHNIYPDPLGPFVVTQIPNIPPDMAGCNPIAVSHYSLQTNNVRLLGSFWKKNIYIFLSKRKEHIRRKPSLHPFIYPSLHLSLFCILPRGTSCRRHLRILEAKLRGQRRAYQSLSFRFNQPRTSCLWISCYGRY